MILIKKYSGKQPQKDYKKISFYKKRLQARQTKQYQSMMVFIYINSTNLHFPSSLNQSHHKQKQNKKTKCPQRK